MTQSHTYLPLDVTAEQRENLTKLADYLLRPKPTAMRFDMRCFAADRDEEELEPIRHECGAVGCAIGHGPAAGLEPLPHETSWPAYSKRVFGVVIHEGGCEGELWDWCFSGGWTHTDNTPEGAGKRIQIALTLGIPSNLDDQRMGAVPLEYRA